MTTKVFPSTIFISASNYPIDNNLNKLLQNLGHAQIINNPDVFLMDANTGYAIETVRQISHFLSRKPYSHQNKIILISQAENLSVESQNTLLKSLEEPGEGNYFVLTTSKPSKIINTVISRCQQIKLTSVVMAAKDIIVIPKKISERLKYSESIPKEQIENALKSEINNLHQKLTSTPTLTLTTRLKRAIKSLGLLEANIEPKIALDYYLLG